MCNSFHCLPNTCWPWSPFSVLAYSHASSMFCLRFWYMWGFCLLQQTVFHVNASVLWPPSHFYSFSKRWFRCCPKFKWYPGSFHLSGRDVRCWMVNLRQVLQMSLAFLFCRWTPLTKTFGTPVGLVFSRAREEI